VSRRLEASRRSKNFHYATLDGIILMANVFNTVNLLYLLLSAISVNSGFFDSSEIILDENQESVYFCEI
jgi:hypothetical protein